MATRHERFSDKAQIERHGKILKALMQRADNRRCADCRKKDPRWASWNLGIFICIRCSGVHRSMGTHISKVKSADLDAWTPEQIDNMLKWGNGKANVYWEHQLPKDMEPPESAIEQWIRAKYERKQYAAKGAVPDPTTIPLPEGVADIDVSGDSGKRPHAIPKVASVMSTQQTALPAPTSIAPAPPSAAPAPAPAKKTASEDLFEAFSVAAPSTTAGPPPTIPSAQQNMKASILSLYNTTPPPSSFGGATATSPNTRPVATPAPTQLGAIKFPPTSPPPAAQTHLQGAQFFGQSFADFSSAFSKPAVPTAAPTSTPPQSGSLKSPISGSLSPPPMMKTLSMPVGTVGGIPNFANFGTARGTTPASPPNGFAFAQAASGITFSAFNSVPPVKPASSATGKAGSDDWSAFQ